MNDAETPGKAPSNRFSLREGGSPLELGVAVAQADHYHREHSDLIRESRHCAPIVIGSFGRGSQTQLQGTVFSLYANTRFVVKKAAKEV